MFISCMGQRPPCCCYSILGVFLEIAHARQSIEGEKVFKGSLLEPGHERSAVDEVVRNPHPIRIDDGEIGAARFAILFFPWCTCK